MSWAVIMYEVYPIVPICHQLSITPTPPSLHVLWAASQCVKTCVTVVASMSCQCHLLLFAYLDYSLSVDACLQRRIRHAYHLWQGPPAVLKLIICLHTSNDHPAWARTQQGSGVMHQFQWLECISKLNVNAIQCYNMVAGWFDRC